MTIIKKIGDKPKEKLFSKVIIYGASGVGKTRLATTANLSNTLFVDIEHGTRSIANEKNIISVDIDDVKAEYKIFSKIFALQSFLSSDHVKDFETIIIDSGSDLMADRLMEITKDETSKSPSGEPDNWAIYRRLDREAKPFISFLRDIKKNIIILSHEKVEMDDKNKVLAVNPSMGSSAQLLKAIYAFDFILRMVPGEITDKSGTTYKSYLTCYPEDGVMTKDRSGQLDKIEKLPPNLQAIFAFLKK